ncbi:hypothetical protein NADFUDRAFT_51917 [Nadsonia fulvescens var. elongata DSM 6958]|uniref:Uncharacterized protein n=1 Tax=Nadsonia fulvescens var. elongata DSM 6958 TaxID=857566 RepID=A0A1E3PIT0_9ASCO|nr:hypothetical protein NADFUDRAFT_51917 [Nadsonia fulvescens var. elongata DSM 6958]
MSALADPYDLLHERPLFDPLTESFYCPCSDRPVSSEEPDSSFDDLFYGSDSLNCSFCQLIDNLLCEPDETRRSEKYQNLLYIAQYEPCSPINPLLKWKLTQGITSTGVGSLVLLLVMLRLFLSIV